jgi:4-hydroxy-3-methylbut-2-enyl diphosphate reductase
VFVSGKKSSNGKVLFEVCKSINPNTYFVSSEEELSKEFFSPDNTVGICGATSTPLWLMEKVKAVLEKY